MPTSAPGITSLRTLLATLSPALHPATFVFTTFPSSADTDTSATSSFPADLVVQMMFREPGGHATVITTLECARAHNLTYEFPCRMVTLAVHSSLDAVGFLAAVTARLAERGMGCNPVSGFFHDHLFVGLGREDEAVEALRSLARENGGE